MAETSQHIVKISADLSQLKNAFKSMESQVKGLDSNLKAMLGTTLSGYFIAGAVRNLSQVASKFQGIELSLKAMTGSAAAAQREMNFLINTSRQLGIDIDSTADSFQKLIASAKGTELEGQGVRDIFLAIAKEAAVLRLSNQQVEKAFYALQQMISKGTVQMEELRGQLGDALPDALQLAADGMGTTTAELIKMISKGEVLARDLIPALGKAIEEKYGKAALEASNTATAGINKFNTELILLKRTIGQGLLEGLGDGARSLADALRNEGIVDAFEAIGNVLGGLIDLGAKFIALMLEGIGDLILLLESMWKYLVGIGNIFSGDFAHANEVFAESTRKFQAIFGVTKKLEDGLEKTAKKGTTGFKEMSKEAAKFQKQLEDIADETHKELLFKDAEARGETFTEAEKKLYELNVLLEKNAKAYAELGKKGKDAVAGIRDEINKIQEAQDKIDFNKQFLEPLVHAAERIQDAFGDAFANILENGVDSFGDLADTLKSIMLKAIAEIAAAMVFKPIIGGVIQGALGSIAPGITGTLLEGLGIKKSGAAGGGLGDLLSGASSAFSLVSGSTTTALTGLGMPAGLAGGLGVALPVAGIAMAIAGIAGLFGGKKKHPGAGFYGMLDEQGNIDNFELKAKHIDPAAVQSLVDNLKPIFQQLATDSINLGGSQIRGRITGSGKGQFGIQTGLGATEAIAWLDEFDPSKAEELDKAMTEFILKLTETADITNNDVVEALKNLKTEGKSLAEVLDEINFAAAKEGLRQQLSRSIATDLTKMFDPALAEIGAENDRYLAQLELAKKIGGDLAAVEKLHNANLNQIRAKYAQVTVSADGMTSTLASLGDAVREAGQRFETFKRIFENLSDFALSLKLGALSPLSAEQKYSLAQAAFEQTSAMARLGNVDAMNNLPGVAQQFLTISREFNAGSGAYTEDFNKVIAASEEATAVAERQMNLAQGQFDTLTAQLEEMQKQTELLGQLADAKNPKGFSYGAAYLANLSNPMASGLINTSIGETAESVQKMAWGNASGLEVRALARALGYGGVFGTGGLDALIQGDAGFKDIFNTALYAIGGTPKFKASGGLVAPGFPYIVGESGQEGFVPDRSGRIMGAHETAAMMAFGSRASNDSGVIGAINDLSSAVRATNTRIEALQKQVNQNQLYRRVG